MHARQSAFLLVLSTTSWFPIKVSPGDSFYLQSRGASQWLLNVKTSSGHCDGKLESLCQVFLGVIQGQIDSVETSTTGSERIKTDW